MFEGTYMELHKLLWQKKKTFGFEVLFVCKNPKVSHNVQKKKNDVHCEWILLILKNWDVVDLNKTDATLLLAICKCTEDD